MWYGWVRMLSCLVVDDDPLYRVAVKEMLEDAGHEVEVVASGTEGIDRGVRWRPDRLVIDWMLKDGRHGLHVIAALAAVRPDVAAVLITSFPMDDLRGAARGLRLNGILPKPFEPTALLSALEQPLARQPSPGFGVAELDARGVCTWLNAEALRLLGEDGGVGRTLAELSSASLSETSDAWVPRSGPSARPPLEMRLREPWPDGHRLMLLRASGARGNEGLADMVLGRHEPGRGSWPRRGRVLIVDDHELIRLTSAALLSAAGATCYTARTHAEALRYLLEDPGIEVAILDYEMPDGDVGKLIREALELRPELILIGNSGADNRDNFRDRGVERYVPKPWQVPALVATIGNP